MFGYGDKCYHWYEFTDKWKYNALFEAVSASCVRMAPYRAQLLMSSMTMDGLKYWEVINVLPAGFSQAVIGKPLHDIKPSCFVVSAMMFY